MLRTRFVLDDELVRFLQGGCALIVCTLDADGEPYASRAWGLTIISADEPARVRLLSTPDVATSGRIAITGTDVPTLHSIQMKGSVVAAERGNDEDVVKLVQYTAAFYSDVQASDHVPRDLLDRMTPSELLALTVEVDDLYDQTPGPRAGSCLT
jgi:hypothetical protein